MSYEGLQAEVVPFKGHNGDTGEAYYARPTRAGKVPGIVVIMHLPGWDEWIIEVARKFAHHGYAAISPHLYFREGPGSPDDIGARVRAAGGVADAQVMGDVAASIAYLQAQPNSNGKVGVIGFCSGGRHAYLVGLRAAEHRRAGRLLGRQRGGRRSGEGARRRASRSRRSTSPRR